MNNILPFAIVAIALIVFAIVWTWALVRNQQMKHELKLKVLEKGRDVDPQLLASLLAVDRGRAPPPQKSVAEQHRDAGGFIGFLFLVAGLIFAFVGMVRGPELSWPLLGLGAFSFAFGYRC
ncbi:MAG: hypothetical protein IT494_00875 [Gammaproteobacteria bacterium]|nr:hypothetical protein [Gammaproteobacteria bacterium]